MREDVFHGGVVPCQRQVNVGATRNAETNEIYAKTALAPIGD
jgi:hypothetical protein